MNPVMDLDVSDPGLSLSPSSSVGGSGAGGIREVEEWGLKVQKMANVFSVTLLFVSPVVLFLSLLSIYIPPPEQIQEYDRLPAELHGI